MLNHHNCRTTIIQLQDTIKELNKKNSELIDKLMSRDFGEYQSVKEPPKDTSEITKPEESPYLELEDVPEHVSDPDLEDSLRKAKLPNS